MHEDLGELLDRCHAVEGDMARYARRRLLPLIRRADMRRTRLFRQWWVMPLSYARCIEEPLTQILLDPEPHERVLDLSSPKLLALYQAGTGCRGVIASDIDKVSMDDVGAIRAATETRFGLSVFDGRRLPFPDASLDAAYSVSAIEHIPGTGDSEVVAEMARVLKPGGRLVVTLPAHHEYFEEWVTTTFYWDEFTETGPDGRTFYQRRYDDDALRQRLGTSGLDLVDAIYVAERPFRPVHVREDGMLSHNSSQIPEHVRRTPLRRALIRIPHYQYRLESNLSRSLRYLTRDATDPQVRQVAAILVKPPAA